MKIYFFGTNHFLIRTDAQCSEKYEKLFRVPDSKTLTSTSRKPSKNPLISSLKPIGFSFYPKASGVTQSLFANNSKITHQPQNSDCRYPETHEESVIDTTLNSTPA